MCPWRWSPWAAPAAQSRPPGSGPGCAVWTSRSSLGIRGDTAAGSRCARPAGSGRRRRARSPGEPAPPDCGGPWRTKSRSHRQLWGKRRRLRLALALASASSLWSARRDDSAEKHLTLKYTRYEIRFLHPLIATAYILWIWQSILFDI